jgi:hypothetical protein
MKCIDIELALMRFLDYRRNLIVANINAITSFEVDLLSVSQRGYAHGFEIKISKSDLMRDFKKPQHSLVHYTDDMRLKRFFKHFKHFSYAVPNHLLETTLDVVPMHFGVYVVSAYTPTYNNATTKYIVSCARKPKTLFNYKWNDREMYQLARLGAIRIHDLKTTLVNHKLEEGR